MRTDPPCVGGPEATTMPGRGTGHCALVLVGNKAPVRASVGCPRPPGPVVQPCPRAGGCALGGAHPCLFAGSLGLGRASGGDPVRVCIPRALLAPTPGTGPGTPVVFRRSVVRHRAGLGQILSRVSQESPVCATRVGWGPPEGEGVLLPCRGKGWARRANVGLSGCRSLGGNLGAFGSSVGLLSLLCEQHWFSFKPRRF